MQLWFRDPKVYTNSPASMNRKCSVRYIDAYSRLAWEELRLEPLCPGPPTRSRSLPGCPLGFSPTPSAASQMLANRAFSRGRQPWAPGKTPEDPGPRCGMARCIEDWLAWSRCILAMQSREGCECGGEFVVDHTWNDIDNEDNGIIGLNGIS